ncbi:putative 2OG-Fe(II) oxygenase family oxidoreductase [Venturia nashicola]|uniref:Putative 2OG-Fe(II) oxygenase family oxidoreductase n=1 Tax=Venturia nashicola TaxID=86259 RepID=A0A4Z1NWK4_9PEZI|nr:putative 2OG-Fe(II) oxygenase family oxidoreductase [Venturia nashicola]TLD32082.1 putative 2OG-Fe(II) oxygenase family oxidoreductase [Venturia nashicola]
MTIPESTIPTVDISPYLTSPSSPAGQAVITSVANACRTSGFFQLIGHGISPSLQQKVFAGSKKLFALPASEKEKIKSVVAGRGFEILGDQTLQSGAKPDLKEGFFVGPEIPKDKEKYESYKYPNNWPSPSLIAEVDLKHPVLEYRQQLCDLSLVIMQILAQGLPGGRRDIFDEFCTDPLAVVRLLHYPPQLDLEDKKQLGAGAHTDFGAITLLLQDSTAGLQVRKPSSHSEEDIWINIPPNPHAYVVNVGDMLDTWTKGVYKSNVHRVINKSGEDRYSIAFFFDGNLEVVIKPLDGSEDKGGGMTVREFMDERYAKSYPK